MQNNSTATNDILKTIEVHLDERFGIIASDEAAAQIQEKHKFSNQSDVINKDEEFWKNAIETIGWDHFSQR